MELGWALVTALALVSVSVSVSELA